MKRYVRTTDNKFYDTTKERYLIDDNRLVLAHEYETHPTMTDGNVVLSVYITEKHVEYMNCGTIANEADDIFSLLQTGDLIRIKYLTDEFDHQKNSLLLIEYQDSIFLESFVKDNFIELLEIYTKQGSDYKLVWTKERGVI